MEIKYNPLTYLRCAKGYEIIEWEEPANTGDGRWVDVDFETYSTIPIEFDRDLHAKDMSSITRCGSERQSKHPDSEILLMSYSFSGSDMTYSWAPGCAYPKLLMDFLAAGGAFRAWNCTFEWQFWNNLGAPRLGWPRLEWSQVYDVANLAAQASLPLGLGACSKILAELYPDPRLNKMASGSSLIKLFCQPHPPKKVSKKQSQLFPDELKATRAYLGQPAYLAESIAFCTYNLFDVITQRAISEYLPGFQTCARGAELAHRVIDEQGIPVDVEYAQALSELVPAEMDRFNRTLSEVTDGAVKAVSEVQKLQAFVQSHGVECTSVDKGSVIGLLKDPTVPGIVKTALRIRQDSGRTTASRPPAFVAYADDEGLIRYGLQFYGAFTMRAAGRLIQPQNLSTDVFDFGQCPACGAIGGRINKCYACDSEAPFEPVLLEDSGSYELCYEAAKRILMAKEHDPVRVFGSPLDLAAGSCRAMVCAKDGHELVFADYKAIEAVALACEAGQDWRIEVFRKRGDIYLESASRMFNVPIEEYLEFAEKNGHHHPDRKKGKVAELALGYAGGLGAILNMGGRGLGDDDYIKTNIVGKWRTANYKIRDYWRECERAAKQAMQAPLSRFRANNLTFHCKPGRYKTLVMTLPSGRSLYYLDIAVRTLGRYPNGDPKTGLSFLTFNPQTRQPKYNALHGGILVQNATQAMCADILYNALQNLVGAGINPMVHIHDEVGLHLPKGSVSEERIKELMLDMPDWAKNYPMHVPPAMVGKRLRKE